MELEKGQNVEYWRDMTVIVEDELRRLKQEEAAEGDAGRCTSGSISSSVLKLVADTLKSGTYSQLAALEKKARDNKFQISDYSCDVFRTYYLLFLLYIYI